MDPETGMKVTIMLADSAQVAEGKLYVLGGGWTVDHRSDRRSRDQRRARDSADAAITSGAPETIQGPLGGPSRLRSLWLIAISSVACFSEP